MTESTVSADTSGRSPVTGGSSVGRLAGGGPVDKRARVDAIRLTSSLSWRSRSAFWSDADVRQPVGPRGAGQGDRERGRPVGIAAVDNELDIGVGETGGNRIDQLGRGGDDRRIAAVRGVPVHAIEQSVHELAAVGLELDPQRRRGRLPLDALRRLFQSDGVGNPEAACGDGPLGSIERCLAVAGDQDRRRIETILGLLHGGQIRIHGMAPSQ